MKKARLSVILLGMVLISVIELVAILNGINGTILTIYMTLMGAAMGLAVPFEKFIKIN